MPAKLKVQIPLDPRYTPDGEYVSRRSQANAVLSLHPHALRLINVGDAPYAALARPLDKLIRVRTFSESGEQLAEQFLSPPWVHDDQRVSGESERVEGGGLILTDGWCSEYRGWLPPATSLDVDVTSLRAHGTDGTPDLTPITVRLEYCALGQDALYGEATDVWVKLTGYDVLVIDPPSAGNVITVTNAVADALNFTAQTADGFFLALPSAFAPPIKNGDRLSVSLKPV